MKRQKWLGQTTGVMLIVLLLLTACGAGQVTPAQGIGAEARAATATMMPATMIPVVPTPTAIPPTRTSAPPSPAPTPVPSGLRISGVITNLDEARPYLVQDSYLQLVRMSGGEVTFVFPADGLVFVQSDLAQISIPPDGRFVFQLDSLAAGKYFVTAQRFTPPNWTKMNAMVLARQGGEPESVVVIDIPEGATPPSIFDMGEVAIILPSTVRPTALPGTTGMPTAGGGTITGTLVDQAGAPLSGWLWLAAVTGKKDSGEDSYEVVTPYVELSETGKFTFGDVPPGEYLIIGFVIAHKDLYATVTISNKETELVFPFSPERGPMVALVDEYESAAPGEYQDYIEVGATGGLLSGSHQFMAITPGAVIDLGTIQVDY